MSGQQKVEGNPYVGPRTFAQHQLHLFFGREEEARDLLSRVVSERLLLFYAQSGAGKSSLINTRLIPSLYMEGFTVLPVGRVSGQLPEQVDQVQNIFLYNLMLSLDQGDGDPRRLAKLTLSNFLAHLASEDGEHWAYDPDVAQILPTIGADIPTQPFVLIIDQFEEIITSNPARWQDREGFFRQLNQALQDDPNLWVVLTMREDYVAVLDPYVPLLGDRLRARFYMERMDVNSGLEAIRRPAELGGRPFAPGVAEKLVEDLRQVRLPGQDKTIPGQYVEPVQLQVVCYQMWENLESESAAGRQPSQITAHDLEASGDVNQALTQFYEETLTAVLADAAAQDIDEQQLRGWFDRELITEAETRGLVHQGETTTGGMPNAVVDILQAQFLVRSEARSGGIWVELIHDRFIEPIRASNELFFEEHLSVLQRQALMWDEEGRPDDLLLRGEALSKAERWAQAQEKDLRPFEEAFLAASMDAAQDELGREKRRTRTTAILALIAMIVAVLALMAFFYARDQWQNAERARTAADQARAAAVAAQTDAERAKADADQERANAELAREEAELEAAERATSEVVAITAAAEAYNQEATAESAATVAADALFQSETNLQIAVDLVMTVQAPTPTPQPVVTSSSETPAAGSPTGEAALTPTPNATLIGYQEQLSNIKLTRSALAGGRIAYVSDESGPDAIFVMDADNPSGARQVTEPDEAGRDWWPAWCGDNELVFERAAGGADAWQEIYAVNLDSGKEREMTSNDLPAGSAGNGIPTCSPDGRILSLSSFIANPGDGQNTWLAGTINKRDGSFEFIGDEPFFAGNITWSPNGRSVAIMKFPESGDADRSFHVIRVDLDDPSSSVVLTDRSGYNSKYPAWSPNNNLVAYACSRGTGDNRVWSICSSRPDRTSFAILLADIGFGSELNNRTSYERSGHFVTPSWSPDGQFLAYASNINGNWEIYAFEVASGDVINLTNTPDIDEMHPVWGS